MSASDPRKLWGQAGILLCARVCLATVFLYSGAVKALDWEAAVAEFVQLGLPIPSLAVATTIAVQLLAGLAVVVGLQVPLAAMVLAAFTVTATLIGHPFWTFEGVAFVRQLTTALEHLAIVGGLVLLSFTGPGHISMSDKESRA